jgi:hypothetical protein
MQYELAAIEQPHVTCWHSVRNQVECHHGTQGAHHCDDDVVVDLVAYSDTETSIYCCSSSRLMTVRKSKLKLA